jgi:SIT4-associating protein SAP185/190
MIKFFFFISYLKDLFFNFKWNNFLHTVVYDMIAQIFNGRMDIGYNKALAISVNIYYLIIL